MKKNEFKLTDELLELKAAMFYWSKERNNWINKLIHSKAVKAGIKMEKASEKFWTEVYKLYPEQRDKEATVGKYDDFVIFD